MISPNGGVGGRKNTIENFAKTKIMKIFSFLQRVYPFLSTYLNVFVVTNIAHLHQQKSCFKRTKTTVTPRTQKYQCWYSSAHVRNDAKFALCTPAHLL